MVRRDRARSLSSRFGGYVRALLAAVMIVVGLLLFTIAFDTVLTQPR